MLDKAVMFTFGAVSLATILMYYIRYDQCRIKSKSPRYEYEVHEEDNLGMNLSHTNGKIGLKSFISSYTNCKTNAIMYH